MSGTANKLASYIAENCAQMTITCKGHDGTVLHLTFDATKRYAVNLFQEVSFAVSEYVKKSLG